MLGETEKCFIAAVDNMEKRTSLLRSAIDAKKAKMITDCYEENKSQNVDLINEFMTVVDPTEIYEKINNVPNSSDRIENAFVAKISLNT